MATNSQKDKVKAKLKDRVKVQDKNKAKVLARASQKRFSGGRACATIAL